MTNRIDWALWRSFLEVTLSGSLSGAARRLQLTQPTVGRHIEQLEQALGHKLFLRSPQGLSPTEEALALLPEAQAMALTADNLERLGSAPADAAAGVVRIAASHVVGVEVLPEALAPLLEGHPRLEIELVLSNDNADLLRHEAELAVRMVQPKQEV
jgi:DNA-binding transcriptional LysR family regulator